MARGVLWIVLVSKDSMELVDFSRLSGKAVLPETQVGVLLLVRHRKSIEVLLVSLFSGRGCGNDCMPVKSRASMGRFPSYVSYIHVTVYWSVIFCMSFSLFDENFVAESELCNTCTHQINIRGFLLLRGLGVLWLRHSL